MSWDLIDEIETADLDAASDQPARARPALRRLVRNLTHIINARDAPNGIASLDSNKRIAVDAVRMKGYGNIYIPSSGTKESIPNGAGQDMEFTHGGGTAGVVDVVTQPARVTIPDQTPDLSRALIKYMVRWTGSVSTAYDFTAEVYKNGAQMDPRQITYQQSLASNWGRGMWGETEPLAVNEGDYFTLRIVHGYTSPVDVWGYLEATLLQ